MEIERSIQPILLEASELASLASKAFPAGSHFERWELLNGGAQNTHYKFVMNEQAFVLRLYARERELCKMEQALHALVEKTVPTAKLIYADANHHPWAYAIFTFVDGIPLYRVNKEFKAPLSYELGKALACIHSFRFPQAGFFEEELKIGHIFEEGSSPYFEESVRVLSYAGQAREQLGEKLSDDILSFMRHNQSSFPIVRGNSCLTHADFKPVNLFYGANGKIIVLDWEFAHAGIGILDFAILLRHRHQFPLDLQALKEGYTQNGGVLPNDWLRLALITDFVNMLTMMDSPPGHPKLFRELRTSFEMTMRHWDCLDHLFLGHDVN
ncbi:phosphotransferase family protein [Candidatus Protochlamydia phocaeensis]|uniref:phosphotransferase family protein n=1 Tax=Candidatus Protochlamydia phocaeensis TaxID=1414722 RepID=UPI0008395A0A|nr:aminoglycoside phosphotransferase family protein [Candidatus Protochlamydia phocaeensis]